MSNYNNNQQQPRPKTLLNHRNLTMWAPNGEGKFASLAFDLKKNDPNIIVRTNIPGDAANDYGRITANVPLDMFYSLLEMIEEAARATTPVRWAYEHRDRKFIGQNKMTDGPVLIYRIIVGREESGVVYFSVVMDKRPNIKFSFMPNNRTSFKDNDGNEMPKDLESKFLALGKVQAIRNAMAMVVKDTYKHPEPRPQNGGGGGGGNNNYNRNNNSGGSGGGGQSSGGGADMASDDIPW